MASTAGVNSRHRNRPPGFSTRAGLGQGPLDPGHVAQPERDRIEVAGPVGDRQPLGIAAQPLDAGEDAVVERPGAAGFEHLMGGVRRR